MPSESGPAADEGRPAAADAGVVDDFDELKNAPADPGRDVGSTGVSASVAVGTRQARPSAGGGHQHLGRPRTGHRLQQRHGSATPARSYKQKYGLDVKFVLLEDPAAKLAAFRKGDVDIMWNTVDNWAREASILAEQNQQAKSIIMQDWSRGGDGIVSLSSIKSVEDLKGQQDRLHAVHAVALPAALPACRSPACRRRTAPPSRRTSSSPRTRPAAAAMFKAKQVDAAVTWEPDLSGAVTARGDEAHVLVSTTAATNIIADTLVRAAGRDRSGAGDRARLRARLARRHRDDQERSRRRRTRSSARR